MRDNTLFLVQALSEFAEFPSSPRQGKPAEYSPLRRSAETEVMVSQLCLMRGSTLNCQTLCLGARPRYSLVVDEDVKKPTNQPTKRRSACKKTELQAMLVLLCLQEAKNIFPNL